MLTACKFFTFVLTALGSIAIAATLLTAMVRKRGRLHGWTWAGAIALVLGLVSWFILVAPVNRAIADALQLASSTIPGLGFGAALVLSPH